MRVTLQALGCRLNEAELSRTGAVREAARSVNNARCSSLNTSGARCVVLAMCLTVTKSRVVMAMMIIYFCMYFNETNY